MIPGPDLYYKCPDCGKIHANQSIASGNTFHAQYFTDNRRVAPMLPEFPSITKCIRCGTIFWLDSLNQTNDNDNYTRDYANFLTTDGFKEALRLGMGNTDNKEFHLLIRLLWRWHEDMEKGRITPDEVYNDSAYNENIDAIQKHIDPNDVGGALFMAELHRFAGRFEEAVAIFDLHLENEEYTMVKESHRRCFEHDRRTYQID